MFYRALFNFRVSELNPVRFIFAIYIFGFSYGTRNHVLDIMEDGFLGYGYAPLPINIYWTALTFLDPLAILLLLFYPLAGIVLFVWIMITDIAVNSSVTLYYYLQAGTVSLDGLPLQIAFGIFVFITAPIARKRIREIVRARSAA